MPSFKTDEALWYNNGVWGELGYAVPNCGDDPITLNSGIAYLVDVIGRNLSAVMHHHDSDLRVPPSINTLTRVHKLVVRARSILAGRQVAPGKPDMEGGHVTPAPQDFLIYPVPYFKVRNGWLREYCGLAINALSDAVQDTENHKPYEISTTFSGRIGQYLHRIYALMCTELFGVGPEAAAALDFTLSDEQLAGYDPGKWFTRTEMIDVRPPVALVPTEDDLRVLTDGIPATQLVGLTRYPSGAAPAGSDRDAVGVVAAGSPSSPESSFEPAPSP